MKSKIQVGAEVTRLKLKQQQSLLTSAPTVLRMIVMAGLWTGMLAHADTAFMPANADADVAAVYDCRSADLALPLDAAAPVAVPDSIVQLTADAQGLDRLLPGQVPRAGTFWLVQPGLSHVVAPMPCPPDDLSLPIYAIGPDGQFLVDGTVGDAAERGSVTRSGPEMAAALRVTDPRSGSGVQSANLVGGNLTRATLETALEQQVNAVLDLISQVQTAAAPTSLRTMSMSVSGVPGFGDTGNGTNTVTYNANSYSAPDYGTNLWLATVGITNGSLALIASNTIPAVQYLIQSRTNLLQTDWQAEFPILGSETTNWTPFSVPQNNRTNLLLRLQSWISSDGSGLPDWWQLLYFGQLGVDPYGNPKGDGWSNYQKFQNGWNPYQFYTPAAPSGLTVQLHQASQTAGLSWLPSAGNVVSYTVEKSYQTNFWSPIMTSSFTTTNLNYTDSLAGNTPDPWSGDAYLISYRVKANYATGDSSALAAPAALQPATVSGAIIPGPNGETYLEVANVPANAAVIRLTMFFYYQDNALGELVTNVIHDLPVAAFNNGRYVMPASWQLSPTAPAHYSPLFSATVRSEDAAGNPSAANNVGGSWTAWGTPFYDGRAQLKQNLIFQLRAAPVDDSFKFWLRGTNYNDRGTYGAQTGPYYSPTNYTYAGLYPFYSFAYTSTATDCDPYLPFEANALFRNFVYHPADVDGGGNLTTGVQNNRSDHIELSRWPTYQFQTNGMALPNLLAANASRWLFYDQSDLVNSAGWGMDILTATGITPDLDAGTVAMPANVRNWFGLPYLSAMLAYHHYDADGGDLGLITNVLNAGTTMTLPGDDIYNFAYAAYNNIYLETAQPQFQTVKYCFYRPAYNWLPGSDLFTPTNDAPMLMGHGSSGYYATNDLPFLIVPAGAWTQIAGYAKLEVMNSLYSGVYGYLGQYFDTAYKLDDSGHATTNTTGVVTPYGYYFATDAGPAALVTMPDLDTGARGTCTVYSVALNLNKSRSGKMDLSFNGPDATSLNSPYVFWANNNFDRWAPDSDDSTNYMDDVMIGDCPYTLNVPTPDYNFRDIGGHRVIPCTRDLQDFTRLWVSGITTNLLAILPTNSTVSLSWGDESNPNSANPTIDLFTAVEADGGMGYLTNGTTASRQIDPLNTVYIGRLGPGQRLQLNASKPLQFGLPYNWQGSHYIWCGVSNGTGGLTLTIADGNGNVLVQTTAYIQIQDIKQMYERWTVGDNPAKAPTNTAYLATEDLPVGVPAFRYSQSQDTNTPYILYVHGWNMERWEKDRFAEAAFKRLYWQGYHGRFGNFRWPTYNNFGGFTSSIKNPATDRRNFDNSEFIAWRSATGLRNKLTDLNSQYPGRVYVLAHSMGNIVTGEAVRLLGTNQMVNTYVASQAAISAHTYDDSLPDSMFPSGGEATPNIYKNWFIANNGGGAGRVINFYNTNDFALQSGRWEFDQKLKPDNSLTDFGGDLSVFWNPFQWPAQIYSRHGG